MCAALLLVGGSAAAEAVPPPALVDAANEWTALAWSVGGTVVAWTVFSAGVYAEARVESGDREKANAVIVVGAVGTLLAPSFGHWYAGASGWKGLVMRGAGLTVAANGLTLGLAYQDDGLYLTHLYIGAALYVGGTVLDIATAPRAAATRNAESRALSIIPVVQPESSSLVLTGQF